MHTAYMNVSTSVLLAACAAAIAALTANQDERLRGAAIEMAEQHSANIDAYNNRWFNKIRGVTATTEKLDPVVVYQALKTVMSDDEIDPAAFPTGLLVLVQNRQMARSFAFGCEHEYELFRAAEDLQLALRAGGGGYGQTIVEARLYAQLLRAATPCKPVSVFKPQARAEVAA